MTAFLIGTAELAALAAGRPGIVAAPGMRGLEALPLDVLQPRQGVLRRAEGSGDAAVPLPPGLLPLAIVAPDAEAGRSLAEGLPQGVPQLLGADPLPALLARLAEALAASEGRLRLHPSPAPVAPGPSAPASPPAPDLATAMAPCGADFQDARLHQYTANADGSYRHLDLGLTGLATAAGVWREVRLKLFDRRGTVGIEIRGIQGWPAMLDPWPKGGSDRFGPFWRMETQATLEALVELASPHNRALIAALLEVLPAAARNGAALAEMVDQEQDEWDARARMLTRAVAAAVDAERTGWVGGAGSPGSEVAP